MELLRPRDFDDAVHRRSDGDPGNRTRDILGRHGLDQNGCGPGRVPDGCVVRHSLDELEELRRMDDRVGDRRVTDQLLLDDLGAEVAAFGEPVGSYHR